MRRYQKTDFPLVETRRHLETGPIVLVSSSWRGERNIMTMGWHMMMQFRPALFGCYIWEGNHSYELIRRSRECVINVPTADLVEAVVAVGNSSGRSSDKFATCGLTAAPATRVRAPLIEECYASFECRLADDSQIDEYGLFIWEVVKGHVASTVTEPATLHYQGQGQFRVAGRTLDLSERFLPQNL
ncbi:flavin reductase family protein [Pseudomonas sp. F(2018)]|uniref:flavin reductase family protein n=1 Tax=Pseudomonas sp. F(2018) TaxID=2502240 RepID=UPI0010F997D6|nr:flavin reductase family protein [Pseudomonas sp. F(2018)]